MNASSSVWYLELIGSFMAGSGVFEMIENWDSVIHVVIDMHKNKIAIMHF